MVADEDVREREESHRERERRQQRAALGELPSEGCDDEADASRCVEHGQRGAEAGGRQERSAQDVLRGLAARLAGRRAGHEHGEDRGREEEADPGERRRGAVRARLVA